MDGTEVCLFWDDRSLPWVLNEEGSRSIPLDEVEAVLQQSFGTWAEVGCSDLSFDYEGLSDSRTVGFGEEAGNENLVLFRQDLCSEVVPASDPCWDEEGCGNARDCWAFDPRVIAVTTTSFRRDTGEILDADIEFNEGAFLFTTADGRPCGAGETQGCVSTDLENTATHEIGHFIGLDHTRVQGATMFASAPLGETAKRDLARDDIEGICDIYPEGQPVNVCEEAYGLRQNDGGGCASTGGAAGLGGVGAGLSAILFRWVRRRR